MILLGLIHTQKIRFFFFSSLFWIKYPFYKYKSILALFLPIIGIILLEGCAPQVQSIEKYPPKKIGTVSTLGKTAKEEIKPLKEEKKETKDVETLVAKIDSKRRDIRSYMVEDGSTLHVVLIRDKKKTGTSQFKPDMIHIKTGDSIEWRNEDRRTHFINSMTKFSGFGKKAKKPGLWLNSPVLKKGTRWIYKFTKPGIYKYHCYTHPWEMIGKIIVE